MGRSVQTKTYRDYGVHMDKDAVIDELRAFMTARDWDQFHTPENLAKSISIEAAELLELYQWDSEVEKGRLEDELADVLTYCYLLADKHGLDPERLILQKLKVTGEKYPVDKARGKSTKYGQL
jgi:NTP pyrophosphatase (non-canonical NTP hydrolase)